MPYRGKSDSPQAVDPSFSENVDAHGVVRLVVVSGVRLYREGLASILDRCPEVHLVGTARTLAETLSVIEEKSADVVVLDMGTAGSHGIVGGIRKAVQKIQVVAFAVEESEQHIMACARAQVSAFVPREGSERDLIEVIRALARGELRCSGRTAAILYRQLQEMARVATEQPDLSALTLREREVLRCVDRGLTNKEIGRELGIEVATVKNHVHKILDKLRVSSRARAAALLRDST